MPIYEYHCVRCDETFERLAAGPAAAVACPACASAEVARRFSLFGVKTTARAGRLPASGGGGGCGCGRGGCGCH